MFVVDTNVLVYAADFASPDNAAYRSRFDEWRAGGTPWFLTAGIMYEFLRVTTHPRVFRVPWCATEAVTFLGDLLSLPHVSILVPTARHTTVLTEVVRELPQLSGSVFHNLHTAVLMREHSVRSIVTRDRDFRRFPFVEVVDPLA